MNSRGDLSGGFAGAVGVRVVQRGAGRSVATLAVQPGVLNNSGIAHGGALFTLADTGMGAALYSVLAEGEVCATIEMNINYLEAVRAGTVECGCEVVRRSRRQAFLEARIRQGETLVATASAHFAIVVRPSS